MSLNEDELAGVTVPDFDPSKYSLAPDEAIVQESLLEGITHALEYYEHRATYYEFLPQTKKELLQMLAEIKREVSRALRGRRYE